MIEDLSIDLGMTNTILEQNVHVKILSFTKYHLLHHTVIGGDPKIPLQLLKNYFPSMFLGKHLRTESFFHISLFISISTDLSAHQNSYK